MKLCVGYLFCDLVLGVTAASFLVSNHLAEEERAACLLKHAQNQMGRQNHKNIGFLSKTDPDQLKNNKATKPAFNVGTSSALQQNAI